MISPVVYTSDESSNIDNFRSLPKDEKKGYWDNTHDGVMSNLKEKIKRHYLDVQDYTCPYCRQRIVVEHLGSWDAEHIIPKETHPDFMFEAENLCVSCKDCNKEKLNKNVLTRKNPRIFPRNSTAYLISHPHFDDYSSNISIVGLGCFYLPKNKKGIKTVEICGLLRFLYKLAGYVCGSKEVDDLIGDLYAELRTTNDLQHRHFLLTAISEIALNGAKQLMQQALDGRLKARVSIPNQEAVTR